MANIHIDRPLADRAGAAPAWDNVLYQDANPGGLGYVDAGHQRLDARRRAGRAHGADLHYRRWATCRRSQCAAGAALGRIGGIAILATLAGLHPDIHERAQRMELTPRY